MGPSHCRHFNESSLTFFLLQSGSAAFLTIYLSRRVVHVSEFKEWKSEPISQKHRLRQFKQGVRKN